MAADSENRLREAMGVYFTEPDRRTSENSVMAKFGLPHDPGPEVSIKAIKDHNTGISSVLCMTGYKPSTLYMRHPAA